ncbi:MAG: hypothetical protein ACI82F_001982 [Planctomycetota bacterium]|jgi:hypothetical protein
MTSIGKPSDRPKPPSPMILDSWVTGGLNAPREVSGGRSHAVIEYLASSDPRVIQEYRVANSRARAVDTAPTNDGARLESRLRPK